MIRNTEFLDVTNNSLEQFILSRDEALGIVDLRSIGYYKVKQIIIHHHLQPYYVFKLLQMLCKELSKLTNTLKREEQQSTDPLSWLAEAYKRSLIDREIVEKYIDLEILCVTQKE